MQDESQDNIKRQQLRELAMLNSVYREDSPHQNGSASPFSNGGTKQCQGDPSQKLPRRSCSHDRHSFSDAQAPVMALEFMPLLAGEF